MIYEIERGRCEGALRPWTAARSDRGIADRPSTGRLARPRSFASCCGLMDPCQLARPKGTPAAESRCLSAWPTHCSRSNSSARLHRQTAGLPGRTLGQDLLAFGRVSDEMPDDTDECTKYVSIRDGRRPHASWKSWHRGDDRGAEERPRRR